MDSAFSQSRGYVTIAKHCQLHPSTERGARPSEPGVLRFEAMEQLLGQRAISCKAEIMPVIEPKLDADSAIGQHRVGQPSDTGVNFDQVRSCLQSLVKQMCLRSQPCTKFAVCGMVIRAEVLDL